MNWLKLFGMFLMGMLTIWTVTAVPTGPSNINPGSSSRYSLNAASNASAIAGNTTELNFESNSVTNTWQGYYGNISGSILLGDSNNKTLYDWTSASPSGEIYATRSAVLPNWGVIKCANDTQLMQEDTDLQVNASVEQDAVNRTFLNTTSFNPFYVGSVLINTTQNCYALNLHNSTGPSTDFQEVLLYDDGVVPIYTSLIKQDANGFDGYTHDFEMVVGENGHNGDTASTPYYFYVELG